MKTRSFTEIENAERSDIGKIAVLGMGSWTIAIEDTLEKCIEVMQSIDPAYEDFTMDTFAHPSTANYGDIIAVEVVDDDLE